MAELQVHGGRAVIAAVLKALGALDGLRLAEPGEFTRRAFESGRIDLTAVEGLADLIAAETEAQRRQAFAQHAGSLGAQVEAWRDKVIEALALVEAGIDFSDEADVAKDTRARAVPIVRLLIEQTDKALAGAAHGERLRDGLKVAIAGPPNAGKSTLLNALARRDAAIVSPIPGTTRDLIEVHLDLKGYPVTLTDTAGIREESADPIEIEGMKRARAAAANAGLVLWVEDAADIGARRPTTSEDRPFYEGVVQWLILNKIDLLGAEKIPILKALPAGKAERHLTSAANGTGIGDLTDSLARFAERYFDTEPALVTRERQHATLKEVWSALRAALDRAHAGEGDELVAEELRRAATALGRMTGRIDVEDVLGRIFSEFCIGK